MATTTRCAMCRTWSTGRSRRRLPHRLAYTDQHNFGNSGGHWARGHTGTDLSAPCGTPVRAASAGTVIIERDQSWAGPWLVQVSTGEGRLTTWYAHMQTVGVTDGQLVRAGPADR